MSYKEIKTLTKDCQACKLLRHEHTDDDDDITS